MNTLSKIKLICSDPHTKATVKREQNAAVFSLPSVDENAVLVDNEKALFARLVTVACVEVVCEGHRTLVRLYHVNHLLLGSSDAHRKKQKADNSSKDADIMASWTSRLPANAATQHTYPTQPANSLVFGIVADRRMMPTCSGSMISTSSQTTPRCKQQITNNSNRHQQRANSK